MIDIRTRVVVCERGSNRARRLSDAQVDRISRRAAGEGLASELVSDCGVRVGERRMLTVVSGPMDDDWDDGWAGEAAGDGEQNNNE
jgi:hypothetical protein